MNPPSELIVDLDAVGHNLAQLRQHVPSGTGVCAVVKADAYGMGALPLSRYLEAQGVDMLCVYSWDQARELLDAGLKTPVLMLSPIEAWSQEQLEWLNRVPPGRLHLTLHHYESLAACLPHLASDLRLPVHVELNTGMNRGGMNAKEFLETLQWVASEPRFHLAGCFSHVATGDTDPAFLAEQWQRFEGLRDAGAEWIPATTRIHFSATYATLRGAPYTAGMVRVGLALFGYGPEEMSEFGESPWDLWPAIRWRSQIVHTLDVEAGQPIGYCGRYRTERATRLGLVPVGYQNGYPRSLLHRAQVAVGPSQDLAPVRGAISMDQISIDLTELPSAGRGTPVELISTAANSPLSLPRLAESAGTNSHELLCRIGRANPKTYRTGRVSC